MAEQRKEIDAIAKSGAAPTFENTIVAMEKSGQLLTRVNATFGNLTASNTNPALEKVQTEMSPKLSAHSDAIFLDAKLFARVKKLYDQRASPRPRSRSRCGCSSAITRCSFARARNCPTPTRNG